MGQILGDVSALGKGLLRHLKGGDVDKGITVSSDFAALGHPRSYLLLQDIIDDHRYSRIS